MERVQFQQEQMLAELRDLVEKKIFTQTEVKQIMKKRTAFETALVRRVAKKADFLRYAAYEMNLEQLRRKRVERMNLPRGPSTVSDYALVRRQFQIFERALRKFKSDVNLWIQYIQLAKREGARTLVGRITARALQLHPDKPALYIIAASHELDHLSPSAARALLQRGIRLNNQSVDMWREYVRMELGFIESLRRRWEVLGIKLASNENDKGKDRASEEDDPSAHIMGQDNASMTIIDEQANSAQAELEGEEGTVARREIMNGAIVKAVITSAVEALPKIELFESLHELIGRYPSPLDLREALLSHLYDLLRNSLKDEPRAIKVLASRFLIPDAKGEQLVDALRRTNEELQSAIRETKKESVLVVYAEFIEHWCGAEMDKNLKLYLITSLRSTIRDFKSSPSLLSAHLRLLMKSPELEGRDPAKVLSICRKYTSKAPRSADVWMGRLAAERMFGDRSEESRRIVDDSWREARRSVVGTIEELERVWTWGLLAEDTFDARRRVHEELLKESLRDSSLHGLHEKLLMQYVRMMHEAPANSGSGLTSDQRVGVRTRWLGTVRHMSNYYHASGKVWQRVFELLSDEWEKDKDSTEGNDRYKVNKAERKVEEQVMKEIHENWRKEETVEATLALAGWQIKQGKGKEATDLVVRTGGSIGQEERRRLENGWREAMDGLNKE
ncbi:hypothetical protein AX16_003863 [Volvariella volvacea WC 439]|nr:hypothetical protein AX16_003863 [Volvariella volvacea WC 439]